MRFLIRRDKMNEQIEWTSRKEVYAQELQEQERERFSTRRKWSGTPDHIPHDEIVETDEYIYF